MNRLRVRAVVLLVTMLVALPTTVPASAMPASPGLVKRAEKDPMLAVRIKAAERAAADVSSPPRLELQANEYGVPE